MQEQILNDLKSANIDTIFSSMLKNCFEFKYCQKCLKEIHINLVEYLSLKGVDSCQHTDIMAYFFQKSALKNVLVERQHSLDTQDKDKIQNMVLNFCDSFTDIFHFNYPLEWPCRETNEDFYHFFQTTLLRGKISIQITSGDEKDKNQKEVSLFDYLRTIERKNENQPLLRFEKTTLHRILTVSQTELTYLSWIDNKEDTSAESILKMKTVISDYYPRYSKNEGATRHIKNYLSQIKILEEKSLLEALIDHSTPVSTTIKKQQKI